MIFTCALLLWLLSWHWLPLSHLKDAFSPTLFLMPSVNTDQVRSYCSACHHHSWWLHSSALSFVQEWRECPSLQSSYLRQPCFPQALWSFKLHTITCNYNYDHLVDECCIFSHFLLLLFHLAFLLTFLLRSTLASKYVNTYFGRQLPNTPTFQLDSSQFIRQLLWSRFLKRKMSVSFSNVSLNLLYMMVHRTNFLLCIFSP